ncbi:MAG TPA: hypothetical protein VKY89_09395 [Thermoanaerobaculia bacterium]|jgi:hypothetical protein|nr:hypothetical protein [Thermoanaerobaculia bacterium]
MRTQSPDTPAEVEQQLIDEYRRMSPGQRLMMAMEMNRAVQQMAEARIRAQYGPDLPERELRLRLAALWIDRETMVRAFGWDPQVEGY